MNGPIATLIAKTRAPTSKEGYASIGGGSPQLATTIKQGEALERAMKDLHGVEAPRLAPGRGRPVGGSAPVALPASPRAQGAEGPGRGLDAPQSATQATQTSRSPWGGVALSSSALVARLRTAGLLSCLVCSLEARG